MKKILLVGGTGAMGTYLVPEMRALGYAVDVVALDTRESGDPLVRYFTANCYDEAVVKEFLKNDYDAVVDFMVYPKREQYEKFVPLYMKNTGHYFFLSTYRVYANEEHPVKESSPRLLDASHDEVLLTSNDYSIYKAESENFVRSLPDKHATILRPSITYSKRRFQLVTLEMDLLVRRMREGRAVVLPEAAMGVEATMSWAGDVAKMIARLVGNEKAFGETFSVCTSEHHTWGEITKMYERIGGLKWVTASVDDYVDVLANGWLLARQQLVYDRLFDRVMDNAKILDFVGMKASELMPLEEGLRRELEALPRDFVFPHNDAYERMDAYLERRKK